MLNYQRVELTISRQFQKEWLMSMDRKRLVPPNILGVRNAVIITDVDKLRMINGK